MAKLKVTFSGTGIMEVCVGGGRGGWIIIGKGNNLVGNFPV